MQNITVLWKLLSAMLLLTLVTAGLAQDDTPIYKSVDENGNAVYSDQAPTPDAKPIVLREPNIVKTVQANPAPVQRQDENLAAPPEIVFLSPYDDETFWGTGNDLPVRLEVQPQLRPEQSIQLYIDDAMVTAISTVNTTLRQIDRGTHTIRAELISGRDEVLASTETRTFHMKQFSQNFNRHRNN